MPQYLTRMNKAKKVWQQENKLNALVDDVKNEVTKTNDYFKQITAKDLTASANKLLIIANKEVIKAQENFTELTNKQLKSNADKLLIKAKCK